jgi:hypothetical protein
MGDACGTCGGEENAYKFLRGNLNKRDHLDGRIFLKLSIQGHGLD